MGKTLAERLTDSDVANMMTDLNDFSELLDSCETDAGRIGALLAMQVIAGKLDTVIRGVVTDNE